MIVYDNLWETMRQKNVSQYTLIYKYGISSSQIARFRKNSNVSTYTINRLCEILDCDVNDIMTYAKSSEPSMSYPTGPHKEPEA